MPIAPLLLMLDVVSADPCHQSPATVANTVAQVDSVYRQAWIGPNLKVLGDTLAEDWTVTHVNGRQQNKQGFLRSFASGRVHFLDSKIDDVVVRPYGSVAVLTARAHNRIQSSGNVSEGDVRLTAVYVCRSGRWRVVSEQATRIDPSPSPH